MKVSVLGKQTNIISDIKGYLSTTTLHSMDMSALSLISRAAETILISPSNNMAVPLEIYCNIPGGVANPSEPNDNPMPPNATTSDIAPKTEVEPPNSKLLRIIKRILESKPKHIHKPPFSFEPTAEAALENFKTLKANKMSLENILEHSPFSPCHFGSEFRDTPTLAPLYGSHPGWEKFKNILENGSCFPIEKEIKEETRLADLDLALLRGNHKSAKGEKEEILVNKTLKEIEMGWSLPLLEEHAKELPGAWFAPMGIAEQTTINERGEFIPKNRQVHDQTFTQAISGTSINAIVDKTKLEPCQYGFMASRMIHHIVGCRQRNPTKRILLTKADMDSAYRRNHVDFLAATKSIMWVMIKGVKILVMCLRLTFGGSPWPSEWSCLSEPICDLTNAIFKCDDWDPDAIYSPLQEMYPPHNVLPNDIPYGQARPLAVNLPDEDHGKCDLFLDDLVAAMVDNGSLSRKRLLAAIPLAIDATVRPIHPHEPLPRTPFLKKSKVIAEGALEERKTILGWHFDTRRLVVALPGDKHKAWSSTIKNILNKGTSNQKEIETMIGRQTHASTLIPMARHFICRIRYAFGKMRYPNQEYRLRKHVLEDLELALQILDVAAKGISMNLLTFRSPSVGYFVDACEHGVGGWNSWGLYWFIELPDHLLGRAHINLLEFLACLIGPWIDMIQGRLSTEDCFLVMGDSTTAAGWIHKTKYRGKSEDDNDFTARLVVARKYARLTLDYSLKLYSQWFPGIDNVVADCLSRDGHLSRKDREFVLTSLFPSQLPPNFRPTQVPDEIISFVSSVLLLLPQRTERFKARNRTGIEPGNAGSTSLPMSAYEATSVWKYFPEHKSMKSSSPSAPSSETATLRQAALRGWLAAQSVIPSRMYRRDSSQLDCLTQGTMSTEKCASA